jgi:hypothetical protein
VCDFVTFAVEHAMHYFGDIGTTFRGAPLNGKVDFFWKGGTDISNRIVGDWLPERTGRGQVAAGSKYIAQKFKGWQQWRSVHSGLLGIDLVISWSLIKMEI